MTALTGFSLSYWSSCLTFWSMEATVPSHECRPGSSSRTPSTQRIIYCRNSIEQDGFSSHKTSGYMSSKMWVLSKLLDVFICLQTLDPLSIASIGTTPAYTFWQYIPAAWFASYYYKYSCKSNVQLIKSSPIRLFWYEIPINTNTGSRPVHKNLDIMFFLHNC